MLKTQNKIRHYNLLCASERLTIEGSHELCRFDKDITLLSSSRSSYNKTWLESSGICAAKTQQNDIQIKSASMCYLVLIWKSRNYISTKMKLHNTAFYPSSCMALSANREKYSRLMLSIDTMLTLTLDKIRAQMWSKLMGSQGCMINANLS